MKEDFNIPFLIALNVFAVFCFVLLVVFDICSEAEDTTTPLDTLKVQYIDSIKFDCGMTDTDKLVCVQSD